jgi:hypothetical protein
MTVSKTDRKVIRRIVRTMRDDAVVKEKDALRIAKPSPVISALFRAMAAEERRLRKVERKAERKAMEAA